MSTASDIVAGLGGQENITDLEPCITRLRVEVADQAKVDEEALRAAGAFGVVRSGRVVQVVVGPSDRGPPVDASRDAWFQYPHVGTGRPAIGPTTSGRGSGNRPTSRLIECGPRHTGPPLIICGGAIPGCDGETVAAKHQPTRCGRVHNCE